MTAWQRRLPIAFIACSAVALGVLSLARGMPSPGQPPATQPSIAAVASPTDFSNPEPRIAIAYDVDGSGSGSLNDLARAGALRAADELGAELMEMTAGPDDSAAEREARLTELADARAHPILAIGSTWAGPLAKVAPKYPGSWFAIVDDGSVDARNVIGIQFNEEQGSFLVGAAAALTSKTAHVGFVGASRTPLLEKFEAGFTAGARAADPGVKVQVAYLSRPPGDTGTSDPAEVKTAALGMYDAGADVIFGTAGDTGNGVIQAAHDRGLWAIGVDTDQYLVSDPSLRDAILTLMLKRADVVTYTIAMEIAMGVPKDGNNVFGVGRGGVGYATSGGFVDPIRARLDAFAAKIASGEILVPTKP